MLVRKCNIAGTVDVKAVAEALKSEPGVVFSTNYQYMCSEAGQNIVKDAVKEHNLTGVVICSCSPRMHEATFRKTAARRRAQPLYGGNRQYPGAVLLGA